MTFLYIGLGILGGIVIGVVIGGFVLVYGFMEGLTNIDGPPNLGWYGEWKIRRANKKYQKQKGK